MRPAFALTPSISSFGISDVPSEAIPCSLSTGSGWTGQQAYSNTSVSLVCHFYLFIYYTHIIGC